MIFVALGTQDFPFDRLLRELDRLAAAGSLQEEIFAQKGLSPYEPIHYGYCNFLSPEEFSARLAACRLLVTHGGAGTIVEAIRRGKTVVGVPRLAVHGEHVDDHQQEILDTLAREGFLLTCPVEGLEDTLALAENFIPNAFISGERKIHSLLEDYISAAIEDLIHPRKTQGTIPRLLSHWRHTIQK